MSIRQTYYRRYRIWSAPSYQNFVATVWPPDSSMPLGESITASLAEGETALVGRVRAYIDATEAAREAARRGLRTKRAKAIPNKQAFQGPSSPTISSSVGLGRCPRAHQVWLTLNIDLELFHVKQFPHDVQH